MTRLLSIGTLVLVVLSASARMLRGPTHMGNPEPPAACQLAASPNVATSPPDMINGAKHPELIPDPIAYRLFFLTVAEPADTADEQRARQRAYLRTAGLKEEDVQPAAAVLATFKSQYDELVGRYNESVQVANETGAEPDLATFLSQQDELVESTRKALEAAIGPEVAKRFEVHVQHEKRNMRITKESR